MVDVHEFNIPRIALNFLLFDLSIQLKKFLKILYVDTYFITVNIKVIFVYIGTKRTYVRRVSYSKFKKTSNLTKFFF